MKCFEISNQRFRYYLLWKWTLNMKCFEIEVSLSTYKVFRIWTLNMKCFEIYLNRGHTLEQLMNLKHEMFWNTNFIQFQRDYFLMNLKHEMFWNKKGTKTAVISQLMNLKHEMFWNIGWNLKQSRWIRWTLNMKCFEIFIIFLTSSKLLNEP